MDKKLSNILGGAAFYASLLVCLVAVGLGGWFWLFGQKETAPAEQPIVRDTPAAAATQIPQMPDIPAEPEPEVLPPTVAVIREPTAAVAMPEEIVEEVTTEPEVPVMAQAPQITVEPVMGGVVAAFSVDELVYDPTFADWRIHCGVDIAAEEGTAVLCARAGTVAAVTEDVMLGTTVVIDHEGGYRTTYANLAEHPAVSAGESVTAGAVIGAVGTSAAAESAQPPHLHFAVTKDGDAVDPQVFLEG